MTQPTDIRAALTEPVGERPSEEAIAEMAEDLRWKRLPWAQGTGDSFLLDLALTVLARWGSPAAPPAPAAGEVGDAIAHQAYVAFVQICKGGSDDAGTYEEDEALVRLALRRLDKLENASKSASNQPRVGEPRQAGPH